MKLNRNSCEKHIARSRCFQWLCWTSRQAIVAWIPVLHRAAKRHRCWPYLPMSHGSNWLKWISWKIWKAWSVFFFSFIFLAGFAQCNSETTEANFRKWGRGLEAISSSEVKRCHGFLEGRTLDTKCPDAPLEGFESFCWHCHSPNWVDKASTILQMKAVLWPMRSQQSVLECWCTRLRGVTKGKRTFCIDYVCVPNSVSFPDANGCELLLLGTRHCILWWFSPPMMLGTSPAFGK